MKQFVIVFVHVRSVWMNVLVLAVAVAAVVVAVDASGVTIQTVV